MYLPRLIESEFLDWGPLLPCWLPGKWSRTRKAVRQPKEYGELDGFVGAANRQSWDLRIFHKIIRVICFRQHIIVARCLCLPPEGIVGVCAGLACHHLPHVPCGGGGGVGGDWVCGGARDGLVFHGGGGEASAGRDQVVLAVKALHLQFCHLSNEFVFLFLETYENDKAFPRTCVSWLC